VAAQDALSGYLPGSLGCTTAAGAVQSGAVFPLGTTLVTCAALDLAGNTGAASFQVLVRDTTGPVFSGVADVTVEATSPAGAAVSFALPTATDAVDGSVPVLCDHASGATYAIGQTLVGCSAVDQRGNGSSTAFRITVRAPSTPPTIGRVPGTNAQNQLIAYATALTGATVSYTLPTATNAFGASVPVSCAPAPGTRFAAGMTTVTCSATDAYGNTGTSTFTVWVQFQVAVDAATGNMFRQPINPDGSSIFKIGSTVSVRFKLAGASAGIHNLVAYIRAEKISDTIQGTRSESGCNTTPDSGDRFHYDSSTGEYVFNASSRYSTQGTYRVYADLTDGNAQRATDGTVHNVRVSLKQK
jgi:hypothetical protein